MTKTTPWFSIDHNGNPSRAGYYDVTYASEELNNSTDRRYWNGCSRRKNAEGETTFFGHGDTTDEYWRGLAEPT